MERKNEDQKHGQHSPPPGKLSRLEIERRISNLDRMLKNSSLPSSTRATVLSRRNDLENFLNQK